MANHEDWALNQRPGVLRHEILHNMWKRDMDPSIENLGKYNDEIDVRIQRYKLISKLPHSLEDIEAEFSKQLVDFVRDHLKRGRSAFQEIPFEEPV